MNSKINLDDITIRSELRSGDIGYIIYMHGSIYKKECGFELIFEIYVSKGLIEFYNSYDPDKDKVWICEHNGKIIGTLFIAHKENNSAQLRYFLLDPDYRGIGLGKKLMSLCMDFFYNCNYDSSYLWTAKGLDTAASLYKRYGFVLTEEIESNAFGKTVKEQKYELKLKKN